MSDLQEETLAFGIVLVMEARLRKVNLTADQEVQLMREIGNAFLARAAAPHCRDCRRVSNTLGRDYQPFCDYCLKHIETTA